MTAMNGRIGTIPATTGAHFFFELPLPPEAGGAPHADTRVEPAAS
jgi:hypothetical protein